ncbi:MAG: lysine--tRNA ligase, partial [Spirochaetales bacterium]
MEQKSTHWADITADKIIREKGDKEQYVCASGITPSGTVHIGNFREIISVELVVRALREKGRKARFIYSWDDYDVFRKVPKNMPEQEMLTDYIRKPITEVPDPYGKAESYARANEIEVEETLHLVGIDPEYIYQAEQYKKSLYAEGMRRALEVRQTIMEILNDHRTEPLPADWQPVSVFCTACSRDTTEIEAWDGSWGLSYSCTSCGSRETLDLRHTGAVKLFWRVDWPMRWKHEGVDFEPAGKDHHSEGGSFDTARRIIREVYEGEAPVTFQYDFISIKGLGGKISSSSGEVISLREVLDVYQPEITRYLFAGTRPNAEFAISFDLDVIKIYEDYDRCERIYFGKEDVGEKRREKEKRTYELSQVRSVPESMPLQAPFRHLCNLLQIYSGSVDEVIEYLSADAAASETRFGDIEKNRIRTRAACAWNWITRFAPEDFRFSLQKVTDPAPDL